MLRPFADLPMMTSLAVACFGSTHHALGVAALTQGHAQASRSSTSTPLSAPTRRWATGRRQCCPRTASQRRWTFAAPAGDAERACVERDRAARAASELGMGLPARHTGPAVGRRPRARDRVARGHGSTWQVRLDDRTVTVPDALGLRYLAMLVERPGQDIAATELALAAAGRTRGSGTGSAHSGGVRQPVLDVKATSQYRARVRELSRELDEHEQAGDLGRAEQARAERDWLLAELVAATGQGGRLRVFADDGERARIAVTKAIRRSVARVAAADPVIGAELGKRVQTGKHCCYTPS